MVMSRTLTDVRKTENMQNMTDGIAINKCAVNVGERCAIIAGNLELKLMN